MIELTRLNGSPLVVNCDLIKYIESSPDTTLTLVTGEKIVVRESSAGVIQKTIAHRALVLKETAAIQMPGTAAHAAAASATSAHTTFASPKTAEEDEGPQ